MKSKQEEINVLELKARIEDLEENQKKIIEIFKETMKFLRRLDER